MRSYHYGLCREQILRMVEQNKADRIREVFFKYGIKKLVDCPASSQEKLYVDLLRAAGVRRWRYDRESEILFLQEPGFHELRMCKLPRDLGSVVALALNSAIA